MSPSTDSLAALIAAADAQPFARWFGQLREQLPLHAHGCAASATFECAAEVTRRISALNLPLGLGLVMHLYPLAALRCVPLPWWSPAARRRAKLIGEIDSGKLILANAGSERAAGAHAPVTVTPHDGGLRIDGAFEYVSLAHVADLVLFSAPLVEGGGNPVFCAADLKTHTVEIGPSRFSGSMSLSDTCSLRFRGHPVGADRFIEIPGSNSLGCMAHYQRSWFHLLLSEAYLARADRLIHTHALSQTAEQLASRNELAFLRDYALRLLDEAAPGTMDSLTRVTAAIKLRVSWLAQSVATAVRPLDDVAATELGFIRLQPTSDARILAELAAA